MENQEKQEKKSNKTTILLMLLLFLSVGFNFYLFKNSSDKQVIIETKEVQMDSMILVKVELDRELNDATEELHRYQGMYANLDSLLTIANSKIENQRKKINNLTKQAADVKILREQLEELKKLKDSLLDQVDNLILENKKLKVEKSNLEQTVSNLQSEKVELIKQVDKASVLKIANIKATALKRKGSGKYVETPSSKRTKRVEVCCDILDNPVAKHGAKDVYLRIISPQGITLSMSDASFRIFGTNEESRYSSKSSVDYNGEKMNTCLYWEQEERFDAGTYKVEVYCEGYLSGAGSFDLK